MLETIKRDWKPAFFQGSVVAFCFVVFLIIASLLLPNKQANLLADVRDAARAQVCVLALPVTERGRSIVKVNECLRSNGLEPFTP